MCERAEQNNLTSQSDRILTLIAICGELPTSQISRLPGGEAYKLNVIKRLKKERLVNTFCKDELRAYRLLESGKKMLLSENAARFSFYLTGVSDTNHVRSEVSRRMRLHRIAETTVTMLNSGVEIFRDRKSGIFTPIWTGGELLLPAFYSSREIKELGLDTVKIGGSRAMGALLAEGVIYSVYNLGDSVVRWEYNYELRFKNLMQMLICHERLPECYSTTEIGGIVLANSMSLAGKLFRQPSDRSYFIFDGAYEHFHFLTNDRRGERILALLCNPELRTALDEILSDDLSPRNPSRAIENDAVDELGNPVLFAYSCDLPRLKRFYKAIRIKGMSGTVICFDFQKPTLAEVLSDKIHFQTISFEKWEGAFFEEK